MKVSKTMAVGLLVAIGFAKAENWDNDKIKSRLAQVPEKVAEDQIPKEYQVLYGKLKEAKGEIEITEGIDIKNLNKGALKALVEDRNLPVKFSSKDTLEKMQEKVLKALEAEKAAAPAKSAPAESEKPAKAEKPARANKAKVAPPKEKDAFGCKAGTISAQVNSVMSDEWKTEEEIAKEAGVTLDQARGRLYYAAEKKVFEYRRLVQYRLPAKK